ncbi:Bud site selection protein RAX2 [Candida viswanathii]|uniref:Bud site selection protein RAX2 n=1 Tax=Candida viswanathii TaxID=5486 RepID=A0A367YDT7_9ASCO|nr:Bud site selection protein RAX2 [Candida viswanathii]
MKHLLQFLYLITVSALCQAADIFQPVTLPTLNYRDIGSRIGLFGSFEALSFYSYVNSSQIVNPPSGASKLMAKRDDVSNGTSVSTEDTTNSLYLQDIEEDFSLKFADLNGEITQLIVLSNDTIIVHGNFTSFNNQTVISPIIYDTTNREITRIFEDDINGTVKIIFHDNGLLYLGGDFQFNNTYSAAVYNISSQTLESTLFQGFGENSSVNSIAKIFNNADEDNDQLGSIIFGGDFDTLGLSDLLLHNITTNRTKHTNTTNTTIISAEQIISLRHATVSTVNGQDSDEDAKDIICPANGYEWAAIPNSGAEWQVLLPDEMTGVQPTKARLYIPEGDNGIKLFRIYTYPNNGIMNLTYIDPATNELAYCDAWCPLLTFDDLNEYVENNIANATDLNEDDNVFVDEENGSYFQYYDPTTNTKNLGYGSNFQEFAFVNDVGVDEVIVTIVDWHGIQGVLAGFELYQNAITVYANNTLNEPNCDSDFSLENNNYAAINTGSFQSIQEINPDVTTNDYLVTRDTLAKVTLYPNISYSGNYSIIMTTPGCTEDNTCSLRAIVNVTVFGDHDNILATNLIYQNNENFKFDYLFYGHLNGSTTTSGTNRIEISYHDRVIPSSEPPVMVVDKAIANIVSLDHIYDKNLTNHTKNTTRSELVPIKLNGLFEYSLANFSFFDELLVHYTRNNQTYISPNNTFVGNSSINLLSGSLSNDTVVDQISLQGNDTLLLLGTFESATQNLTLLNNNLLTLSIQSYNNTANETIINLPSRLRKRATQSILGGNFNNSITRLVDLPQGVLAIGEFSLSVNDSSSIRDLSNDNNTISSANNFALYDGDQWYSFGNDYIANDFNQFTNVSISGTEFYVFSGNGVFRTWDNGNFTWVTDPSRQLNLTQAAVLNERQQILGGTGFNTMDFYSTDQAYIADGNFSQFGIDVNKNTSFIITNSFYVNSSLSVIGGRFESDNVKNVGFINNTNPSNALFSLQGDATWGDDAMIQSLYVDNDNQYLFMGVNGSVSVGGSTNLTGIVIYDLVNNTFTSFQPPVLSNSNGDPIEVNSMVLYNQGNRLLVGGKFDLAGSLSCPSVCVYDISNTRWINPQDGNDQSRSISGVVTDMKFFQSNQALIAGTNLTLNDSDVKFLTYNFESDSFDTKSNMNNIDGSVQRFILNDQNNKKLNGRLVALGEDSIYGFDGSNWSRIDGDIVYENYTTFNDIKLLTLASASNYNETYFSRNNILTVAGVFDLRDYGLVNMALFNGTSWIPYVFTSESLDESSSLEIGDIKSILIDDSNRFQSSDDLKDTNRFLSRGKIVGISLACALGSTTLLGLLYIIPYFALFRTRKDGYVPTQRIEENEMMNAVNPEDLLHEIDLQREK